MYNITQYVFGLLFLSSVSICTHAQTLPAEFTAYYQSSTGLISGKSIISLTSEENNSYRYQSVTTVTGWMSVFAGGKIFEQSYGKYVNGKIRPIKYVYKRTGKKERYVELKFDWENHKVTNSINSDPWKMAIDANTLDKLVYQLVMMHDLQKDTLQKNNIQQIKELNYSIADGGKLKNYTIAILGKEKISTKLGELQTIKVSRTNGKRTVTMWCAEKFGFLPVWIRQEKKGGNSYTAKIYKLDGFPDSTATPATTTPADQQ